MNQSENKIMEDFIAQQQDISEKVDNLVICLKECLELEIDSQEKELKVFKCAEKVMNNFDIYTFIDFVQENQVLNLQNILNMLCNKFKDSTESNELIQKLFTYQNICDCRLNYLKEVKKNKALSYYHLLFQDKDDINLQEQQKDKFSHPVQNPFGSEYFPTDIEYQPNDVLYKLSKLNQQQPQLSS